MATTKDATASSRKPSTSTVEDEARSSWPMSWWIGGGIAGTIIVGLSIWLIHFFFGGKGSGKVDPVKKNSNPVLANDLPQLQVDPAKENSNPVLATESPQLPVAVGGKCTTGNHHECVDHAVCSGDMCKALLGATCDSDPHCWQPDFNFVHNTDAECIGNQCQVPVKSGKCGKGKVVGNVCKAGEGMICGSPQNTPMDYWCSDGLTCVQGQGTFLPKSVWKAWTCKPQAGGDPPLANIQLEARADAWLLTNASSSETRAHAGKASNLRRTRTRALDASALQVDPL